MKQIIQLIKTDLIAINAKHDFIHIFIFFLCSYNKRPLIMIRLLKLGGFIEFSFRWFLRHHYMIEVNKSVTIGPYLRLPHPRGIILAAHSIGRNCLIGQFVTLGGNNCKVREENGNKIYIPEIGDNVQILAGSVIAGPVVIGSEVIIGANSTVTFDIPPNTLVYNRPSVSTNKIKVPGYLGPFYRS